MKQVIIAAGGSGGHVLPAQVVAKELQSAGISPFFLGAGLSTNPYFEKEAFPYCDIPSAPPSVRRLFCFLMETYKGVKKAISILRSKKPDLVIGFGSYHSVPVLIAARFLKIPYVLFEANAVPGRVIRLFSKKALWTGCYFKEAGKQLKGKILEVDMPLRHSLRHPPSKEEALRFFGLSGKRPVALVFGGSQGAHLFNTNIPQALSETALFDVIHLAGKHGNVHEIEKLYHPLHVCVQEFCKQMEFAYQAADVVISRAGASAICEISYYKKRALLIPFEKSQDQHQLENAKIAANSSYIRHLPEQEANLQNLRDVLQVLCCLPVVEYVEEKKENFISLIKSILK